jgi:hypothetical protein
MLLFKDLVHHLKLPFRVGLALVALNIARADSLSEWVHPGPDGKLIYKTTATGDRIMDFSTAGYHGGGVALPTVPVIKTIRPSRQTDDTALIQGALNELAKLPIKDGVRGALLLAPGVYPCSNTIVIPASGIVLRGSGETDPGQSIILMSGKRHVAITTQRGNRGRTSARTTPAETSVADAYVPSGTSTFSVVNAAGFALGDVIEIRRPVTEAWVKFMGMDNLVRNGMPQTWMHIGDSIDTERRIAAISGNHITVDVPLSDSCDAKYLNPPGTAVVKIPPPARLTEVGIEHLRIRSPGQHVNHTQELYNAIRLNGEDCWIRDVNIDETMNSVGIGGRRITLQRVTVTRRVDHVGSSKPAEFAPNGDQILLDHCSVNANNVWFAATGSGHSGPTVFLNCSFSGDGHIEGHMRWSTGMLLDNCRLPNGGIDFKNRGSMGSGHGWGMGWAVAWNCVAKSFVIQQPPGAFNWAIGCIGETEQLSRPFEKGPPLPVGVFDSPGKPVVPQSLYLTQLSERLGPKALTNIGYAVATASLADVANR